LAQPARKRTPHAPDSFTSRRARSYCTKRCRDRALGSAKFRDPRPAITLLIAGI
jgi:hypothetical protein